MNIKIKFELKYMFFGIYWDYRNAGLKNVPDYERLNIWICIVPMLPIHIEFY